MNRYPRYLLNILTTHEHFQEILVLLKCFVVMPFLASYIQLNSGQFQAGDIDSHSDSALILPLSLGLISSFRK